MTDIKLPYASEGDDEDYTPPAPWRTKLSDNIPALIGFLILVVVVMWGLAHLLMLAQPWLSSIAPRANTGAVTQKTTTSSMMPTPILSMVANPGTRTTAERSARAPSAPPDLSVHILAVGVIDPATGVFVNRPPTSLSDVAAVQFDIANDGGSSTGAWYFDAQLPTTPQGYAYTSPQQEPLAPGDHIVNTLRFSPVIPGGGVFNVIIDSTGMVNESNETNNTATIFIPMPGNY